jgi:alpha-L-fucosidase 2
MPRYCLDLDAPAEGFIDSFLIGNGWLGAIVKGGIGTERFDLNLDTVWSGGPLTPQPGDGPAHLLPELRGALLAGDYLRADELAKKMQGKRWTQSYQPLGGIELRYADDNGGGYQRRLDLAEAVATSTAGVARLESFVSYPDGVLVARAIGAGVLDIGAATLGYAGPHPGTEVSLTEIDGVRWLVASGRVPDNVVPNYVESDGEAISYAVDPPDANGTVAAGMGFAVVAALVADPAGGLRLVASAASGFRGYE